MRVRSDGYCDGPERGAKQPLAEQVDAAHDIDTGRLADIGRGEVRDGLVPLRVEGVTLLTERAQPELGDRDQELFGDGRERPDEISVLPGPVNIIEYRQQLGEHRTGHLLG